MLKSLKEMSIMCSEVERAIETYDHVVWEAIIRVCGMALSKSFRCEGDLVRVVYQTYDQFFPGIGIMVDPREAYPQILAEVERLVSLSLPIVRLASQSRKYRVASDMCSNRSYHEFLMNGSKVISEEDQFRILFQGGIEVPVYCGFVEIGKRGEDNYICCPCVGEHLANTAELSGFKINLRKPKRVGRDTYEFRFHISR